MRFCSVSDQSTEATVMNPSTTSVVEAQPGNKGREDLSSDAAVLRMPASLRFPDLRRFFLAFLELP